MTPERLQRIRSLLTSIASKADDIDRLTDAVLADRVEIEKILTEHDADSLHAAGAFHSDSTNANFSETGDKSWARLEQAVAILRQSGIGAEDIAQKVKQLR